MKTLTIHGITPDFFDGVIEYYNYRLTFDDCLFSQYFYWPLFRFVPVKKIFFVSTNLIGIDGLGKRKQWNGKDQVFPDCFDSLEDFRKTGNRENYMRIEELRDIIDDGVEIGAHGHNHIKFFDTYSQLADDVEQMLLWFEKYLNIRPTKFAFPHYVDIPIVKKTLETVGFTEFYGNERLEIEQEKNILSNV